MAPFTVAPKTYQQYTVTVSENNLKWLRIEGSFKVNATDESGIKVYVMDDSNFVNWQNNHAITTYYASEETKTGYVNAEISSGGTYHLVFDNTFSATPKEASASIMAYWQ